MGIRVGWLPTGTQSAEDTRQAFDILLTPTGSLLVRNGYIPTVSSVTPFALTSTGSLSCSVGPGQAIVRPDATSSQGAYPVTVDATGSGLPTVSFAAGGSLARTDVIYLQVQDTAEDASGFTRGQVAVVQGANGGGVPAVPTGTVALWQVPVPASATSINFATATFVAPPTVCLGGVFPSNSSGTPGLAHLGQTRSRTDRSMTAAPGPLEVYDGAAWQTAIPAAYPRGRVASATVTAIGNQANSSTPNVDQSITVTLSTSRRYRLWCSGSVTDSVGGDQIGIGLYYIAGSSIPSNASGATLLASMKQSADTVPFNFSWEFVGPGNGTFTLAMAYWLASGSGFVVTSNIAPRQLWLEDVGI